MHLKLTPLDIAFLRSVDHVVADIRSDESRLRAENRVLTDMLVAAEEALVVERRTARLMLAFAWVAMGVAR